MKKMIVSVAVGCLFTSTVLGAGLVNGSFEVDSGMWKQGVNPPLPSSWGWVIGSGDIDHLNTGYFGFPPADGEMYIDLNGFTAATIYQDFTFPGSGQWAISFDMEANPLEYPTKTMRVEFGEVGSLSVLGDYGLSHNGGSWVGVTTPFLIVDDSTTYRLQFTSTTPNASGPLLDNVRLTPIPEPTTFTLLGLGSLSLLMVRRRR